MQPTVLCTVGRGLWQPVDGLLSPPRRGAFLCGLPALCATNLRGLCRVGGLAHLEHRQARLWQHMMVDLTPLPSGAFLASPMRRVQPLKRPRVEIVGLPVSA